MMSVKRPVMAVLPRRDRVLHPVQSEYEKFCRKLARRRLERRPSEGPIDFARRVGVQRPDLSEEVQRITRLYAALRYGRLDSERRRRLLRRWIQQFHP